MLCILAGIYKLISKTVPIIDFYDTDDVLYWFKYIFFLVFICVVKTYSCSYFPQGPKNADAHNFLMTAENELSMRSSS